MKLTKIISYIHLLGCIGWSIFGLIVFIMEHAYKDYKDYEEMLAFFALFVTTASGIYLFIVGRKKQPENIKTPKATLMTKIISYIHLLGCIGWSIFGVCLFFMAPPTEAWQWFILVSLFVTTASGIYLSIIRFVNWRQNLARLQKRPHLIPAIIAAVMLFGALGQWPDDYYQLLRFVTCCVSVYVAYTAYTWQKMWAVWLFGFIAVLFNPLAPIHFSRELWQYIDIICAVLFTAVAFILRKPTEEK
jgi:hypothetical protein